MAKTLLGVDIGTDTLKLALCSGTRVKKAVFVPMPKNLVQEGRIVSPEAMGELIRTTMKENGIRAKSAAYVLPSDQAFVRNVTMPRMTAEQLTYNLPYEFNDYITDELRDYVFDYAMLTEAEDVPEAAEEAESEAAAPTMELMAVGASKTAVESAREMLRKAGLKMDKLAPAVCSYVSLIRELENGLGASYMEYCILDLGYRSIRMYMFRGDRHVVTRELEIGMEALDRVIADSFGVDEHLAHTYLLTNYEDCQNSEACVNAYNNIAVELMRALNFYRFSTPDSQLSDIWMCGGGAVIPALRRIVAETLDMGVHRAEELVPQGELIEDCYAFAQAVGITMD